MQYFYKRNEYNNHYYTYVVVTEDNSAENGYTVQCGNTIEHALADYPKDSFVRNDLTIKSFEALRTALRTHSMEFSTDSHPELFI